MQSTLPIHFAPLQGYTEAIYRQAHARIFGGIESYYTPFCTCRARRNPKKRHARDCFGKQPWRAAYSATHCSRCGQNGADNCPIHRKKDIRMWT